MRTVYVVQSGKGMSDKRKSVCEGSGFGKYLEESSRK